MHPLKSWLKISLVAVSAVIGSVAFASETIWIDVRSSEEFQAGHLPGAHHIVHTEIADKIAQVTQDKNAEIKLYCRSGRRSGLAEAELKKLGFTNVQNAGGYEALQSVVKPQP